MDVHLENGQRVYFDHRERKRVENPRNTTLMAFFKLCQEDNFAKTLLTGTCPAITRSTNYLKCLF